MTETETEAGTEWDAPNQQVVRADQSAPWEEGTGGAPPVDVEGPPVEPAPETELDGMTKAEMLDRANTLGVEADESMTKAQIHAAINAAGGG